RARQIVPDEMQDLLREPIVLAHERIQKVEGVPHQDVGLHRLLLPLVDVGNPGGEVRLGLGVFDDLEAPQPQQDDLNGVARDVDAGDEARRDAYGAQLLDGGEFETAAFLENQADDGLRLEIPHQLKVLLADDLEVDHEVGK